jgi:hypothetical protein
VSLPARKIRPAGPPGLKCERVVIGPALTAGQGRRSEHLLETFRRATVRLRGHQQGTRPPRDRSCVRSGHLDDESTIARPKG